MRSANHAGRIPRSSSRGRHRVLSPGHPEPPSSSRTCSMGSVKSSLGSAAADPADTRPSEPPRSSTARLHPRRVQEGHRDARALSAGRQVVVVGGQTGWHLGKYRSQADPHAEQCTFPSASARLLMCTGQEQPRGIPLAVRLCRSGGASQSRWFQRVLIKPASTECARDKRGQADGRFHQSRGECRQSESNHGVHVGCADCLRLISICVSGLAGASGLS